MKITLDQTSVDAVIKDVEKDLIAASTRVITRIGDEVVEAARATTKFHHGSHFDDGIQFTLQSASEGQVKAEVFNSQGVEYANFMEYGNGPVGGRIQAVNGPYLHFKGANGWVRTKSVSTIAAEKRGFFTDAVTQVSDKLEEIVKEEFSKE